MDSGNKTKLFKRGDCLQVLYELLFSKFRIFLGGATLTHCNGSKRPSTAVKDIINPLQLLVKKRQFSVKTTND